VNRREKEGKEEGEKEGKGGEKRNNFCCRDQLPEVVQTTVTHGCTILSI
jgi:hypothetical protein